MFNYYSAPNSTASAPDKILEFTHGDKIGLVATDADGNAANGDTKFTCLASGAFTKHAGELRVSQHATLANAWVVEGDTNGDGVADLLLYVVGPPNFVFEKSDFYV